MITLPAHPQPNGMQASVLDFSSIIRASTGAAIERYNRKGARHRVAFSMPPMPPETARVFIARLLRGKFDGVRLPLPLLVPQGSPGSACVVDGAGQAGTTLLIRGVTPGYVAKEGYWLSIVDATGQHYLHCVAVSGVADGTGDLSIGLNVELRTAFADGAAVHIAKPIVEGFIDGDDWSWAMPATRLVALEFTVEEAA